MQRLEQVRKPTRRDHFRQSGICYVIILLLIVSIFFLLPQVYGADGVAYTPDLYYVNAMILGGITLWAIFVNALFLYIRRKI